MMPTPFAINHYKVSALATVFVTSLLAIYVLLKDNKRPLTRCFAANSASIAAWAYLWYRMICAKNPAKSAAYFELATRLNPRNAAAWSNLAIAYTILAKHTNGPEAKNCSAMAVKCSTKLDELGFVDPKDVPQFTPTGRP